MSRTPRELLVEALVHFRIASDYAGVGDLDQLAVDAISMRISAGIEVLARLGTQECDRVFGEDWALMWGMRNRIAHGYLLVDPEIVRRTTQVDLPEIVRRINGELGISD